jgi:hypothetical protein
MFHGQVDEKLTSYNDRVPSMSSDLIESDLAGYPLDALAFGGAPAANALLVLVVPLKPQALKSFTGLPVHLQPFRM